MVTRSRRSLTTAALTIACIATAGTLILLVVLTVPAHAHCDTLDGPVVAAGKTALDKQDPTPFLRWLKPDNEREAREVFTRCLAVRAKSAEAKELADRHFLETLVRLHRAGEGAPYTGLKSAGADVGPAVAAADRALESGNVDAVVKLIQEKAAAGIRRRFTTAHEARGHAGDSIEAGRRFVAAYVEYVHYVERLEQDAAGSLASDGHEARHEHDKPK